MPYKKAYIAQPETRGKYGFTLMEMSIVLIVIGLIVGGIITGQDMINAAAQRAQATQIGKYNTIVHTFQNKYGNLPGDIPDPYAAQFGFQSRGTLPGEGDGNGVIQGDCSGGTASGFDEGNGELAVFWQDLATAQLLDTGIGSAGVIPSTTSCTYVWTAIVNTWLPSAKIGQNNFIYLFSINGTNYFGVSMVDAISWTLGTASPTPGITVQQAYNIDSKIDDGLPQSGSVTACYVNSSIYDHHGVWAAGGGLQGDGTLGFSDNCVPVATTESTPYATTNCYDNNGIAGVEKYSLTNSGLPNCALSFKFQ